MTRSDHLTSGRAAARRSALRLLPILLLAAFLSANCHEGSHPLILVHGYEGTGCSGIDLKSRWEPFVDFLRANSWTARIHPVAYYSCDTPWTHSTKNVYSMYLDAGKGSCPHDEHYASGHNSSAGCGGDLAHTSDTKINHLGYHLAWEIYNLYSKHDVPVNVLGHSMGGLIARYALAKVEEGHPDFPPKLMVSDVVTFGTPHLGANEALTGLCYSIFNCPEQLKQMKPDSGFLQELEDTSAGQHPDPDPNWRTQWLLIGSNDDDSVSEGSAAGMRGDVEVTYWSDENIEHDDYFAEQLHTQQTAHATIFDRRTGRSTETYSTFFPAAMAWFDMIWHD